MAQEEDEDLTYEGMQRTREEKTGGVRLRKDRETATAIAVMGQILTTSWDHSLTELKAVLPAASSLAIDEIHRASEQEGRVIVWKPVHHWEDLEDVEILGQLFEPDIFRGSAVAILLPDICFWGRQPPFLVQQEDIQGFVASFFERYGEAFFNGDTIIILPSAGTIYLFNHDGLCGKFMRNVP